MTWPTVALGTLLRTTARSLDPTKHLEETFELFSVPAYERRAPDIVRGKEIGSTKLLVEPGDVMLCRIVPHIRRGWVVPTSVGYRQIASGEWIILRHRDFAPGFLRQFVLSEGFHEQFMRTVAGVGGSLMRARPAQAAKIMVPHPPIDEQLRVSAILDKAEELRAKRSSALAVLAELADAVFVELFEGSERWPIKPLAEVLSLPLRNGVSPSTRGTVDAEVLTLSAITRGRFDPSVAKFAKFDRPHAPSKTVIAGELLICRGNGNRDLVGRGELATVTMSNVAFPDTIIAAKLNDQVVDGAYVQAVWNRPRVRRQIEAGARTTNGTFKVNQEILEAIDLPIPPLPLQREFAKKLRTLREVAVQHHEHLRNMDELIASLESRAFDGRL